MKGSRVALLRALAACALAGPQPAAAGKPLTPVSPQAAVRCLGQAWENRSIEQVAALYSADYRFHFSAGDKAGAGYLNGLDRERDLASASRWFGGAQNDPAKPPLEVESVRFEVGKFEESTDPEHPDSLAQYRVVVAHQFAFDIRLKGGERMEALPAEHVFYLVRGDVAQRADGQPASASRWYIRRWMEDVPAMQQSLAAAEGHCEETGTMAASSVLPEVFGVRALDSPLCATLDVVCDLPTAEPATLEVYDLQGRRLAKQVVNPTAPGSVRVQAGSGQRFAPGAYWLRLTQGRRAPSRRMVIVAR